MGEVVWLTPVEYGFIFRIAYTTVTERCRAGEIPGAEKDPKNGYFWRIPIEADTYNLLLEDREGEG